MFFVSDNVIQGEIVSDTVSRNEQSISRSEQLLEKQTTDFKNKFNEDEFNTSFSESLVPSVKKGELMLQEMCENAGGNSSYDTASVS